nr:hypothetical protein [Tanacetum cinerariifolium]
MSGTDLGEEGPSARTTCFLFLKDGEPEEFGNVTLLPVESTYKDRAITLHGEPTGRATTSRQRRPATGGTTSIPTALLATEAGLPTDIGTSTVHHSEKENVPLDHLAQQTTLRSFKLHRLHGKDLVANHMDPLAATNHRYNSMSQDPLPTYLCYVVMDTIKKDKIQAKPDKTEHKSESVGKSAARSQQKVKPDKVEAKETKKLGKIKKRDQNCHFPKCVDAPAVAIEEQLERIEYVVDEKIKRPRKRKKENEDESSSANVLSFGNYFKQDEKVESNLEAREDNKRLWKREAGSMSFEEHVAWVQMTLKDFLHFLGNCSASFSARPVDVPMSVGSPASVANNAVGTEVVPPAAGRRWRDVVARPFGSP